MSGCKLNKEDYRMMTTLQTIILILVFSCICIAENHLSALSAFTLAAGYRAWTCLLAGVKATRRRQDERVST